MDCPNCRLVNPATALRCDCGYDFKDRTLRESDTQRAARQASTTVPLRLLVQVVALALAIVGGMVMRLSKPKESATGELLREAAFQRFKAPGKSDRITDPALAFIDRFH